MTGNEVQELVALQREADYLKKSYDSLKKNYVNQYVAIKNGDVVAHHEKIDAVLQKIKNKKLNPATVLIEFVHPKDLVLIL
ncbi:MAG: DUF5678 domain-containing protein [Euryarchaeota archaeon]|nr:DUF5678 domain-containing protein [Euryarchaeota archaeon]